MKTIKLIIMIVFATTSFTSFGARLTSNNEKDLFTEAENFYKANKDEQGNIAKIKLLKKLDETLILLSKKDAKIINKFERKEIYNEFVKNFPKKNTISLEELTPFVKNIYSKYNNSSMKYAVVGESCNLYFCGDKNICDTKKEDSKLKGKKAGEACSADIDCASSDCRLKDNKKVCAQYRVCFKPLALNESCKENLHCEQGLECTTVINDVLGVGLCTDLNKKPTANMPCCSGLVSSSNGKCELNRKCLAPCSTTKTSKQIPECCSPRIRVPADKIDGGACELPTVVPREIKVSFLERLINIFVSTVSAGDEEDPVAALAGAKTKNDNAKTHLDTINGQMDTAKKHLDEANGLTPSGPCYPHGMPEESDSRVASNLSKKKGPPPCDGPEYLEKAQKIADANAEIAALTPTLNEAQKTFNRENYNYNKLSQAAETEKDSQDLMSKTFDIKNKDEEGKTNFFKSASNPKLCIIDLLADYRNILQKNTGTGSLTYYDLEIAISAFTFITGGNELNEDYIKVPYKNKKISLNEALNKLAKDHSLAQTTMREELIANSKLLECQCFTVHSQLYKSLPENSTDANVRTREKIKSQCSTDINKRLDEMLAAQIAFDEGKKEFDSSLLDDASGVKAAGFLTEFATILEDAAGKATKSSDIVYGEITKMANSLDTAINSGDFLEMKDDTVKLYDLPDECVSDGWIDSAMNFLGSVVGGIGDFVGSVVGGIADFVFGSSSSDSGAIVLAQPGADKESTAEGYLLLGAWMGNETTGALPYFEKRNHGNYGKGGKLNHETCTRFKRYVHAPKSTKMCGSLHASAGSCIKSMTVYDVTINEATSSYYILDPFIPMSVANNHPLNKSDIVQADNIKNLLEAGFDNGLTALRKEYSDSQTQVSSYYCNDESRNAPPCDPPPEPLDTAASAITPAQVKYFVPNIPDFAGHKLSSATIEKIKINAKEYAKQKGIIPSDDEDDLNKFADYAFKFHFLLPKRSQFGMIRHEPAALSAYLNFMSEGVHSASVAFTLDAGISIADLKDKYQQYEIALLGQFPKSAVGISNVPASTRVQQLQQMVEGNKAFRAALKNPFVSVTNFGNTISIGSANTAGAANSSGASGSSNMSAAGGMSPAQNAIVTALATYNKIRQDKLVKKAAYDKAASSSKENQARSAIANSALSKFSNAMGSSGVGGKYSGGGDSNNSMAHAIETVADKTGKSASAYPANKNSNTNVTGLGIEGLGADNFSAGSNSSNATSNGLGNASSTSENDLILSEAIDARNKNADRYKNGGDDLTLFEIITNTYIRNYDKLFIKKVKEVK